MAEPDDELASRCALLALTGETLGTYPVLALLRVALEAYGVVAGGALAGRSAAVELPVGKGLQKAIGDAAGEPEPPIGRIELCPSWLSPGSVVRVVRVSGQSSYHKPAEGSLYVYQRVKYSPAAALAVLRCIEHATDALKARGAGK